MRSRARRPVIFGEVLFDHFPDGARVLGGAPFNVAWHLQAFGLAPLFISRVGDDPAGREVRQAMADWGIAMDNLERLIIKLTTDLRCYFILTAHMERETDEVTGGTFTVTNVSMFQVDGFTPILKPPETGILGVGRVKKKPAVTAGFVNSSRLSSVAATINV